MNFMPIVSAQKPLESSGPINPLPIGIFLIVVGMVLICLFFTSKKNDIKGSAGSVIMSGGYAPKTNETIVIKVDGYGGMIATKAPLVSRE